MEIQAEIQKFARDLRRARRQAGERSYRELARRTEYSISTISRVLTGKTFPRWDFTERFLRSCDIADPLITGRWHTRWLEIAELLSPIGGEDWHDDDHDNTGLPPAQPGEECPECGTLVVNPLRHQAWHATYIRRGSPRPSATRIGGNGGVVVHRLTG